MIQFVHNPSFSEQVNCWKVGAMELMVLLRAMSKEMDVDCRPERKKKWNQEMNNKTKKARKI